MPTLRSALAAPLLLALTLAACSGQKEPAQKYMAQIHTVVMAASGEAAKYVPEQLAEVQTQFIDLQGAFDKKDYDTVVAKAPGVLQAAEQLATIAASKKDEVLKQLNDDWTHFSTALPAGLGSVQDAIAAAGKKGGKKAVPESDLNAAKSGIVSAASLWSKAQAAFAAGNLEEAVHTCRQVQEALDAAAHAVKVDLAAK
jgi:hypothetical protein